MNRFVLACALCAVSTPAMAQFVGGATGEAAGQRGTEGRGSIQIVPPARGQEAIHGQDATAAAAPQAAAPGVNRMFDAIDANGDGVISKVELQKAVVALRKLDVDGDGNITLAEATGPAGPAGPTVDVNSMVDQTLAQYDKNKDGRLTADEVPPEMAMTFRMADQNGDSSLTRPELAAAIEMMQAALSGRSGGFRGAMNQAVMGEQMMRQMLSLDRNGDGRITPDEVPPQILGMLQGADRNNDRAIDAEEMKAFITQMSQRMGRGPAAVAPMGNQFVDPRIRRGR